jgi:hypothetical protein
MGELLRESEGKSKGSDAARFAMLIKEFQPKLFLHDSKCQNRHEM